MLMDFSIRSRLVPDTTPSCRAELHNPAQGSGADAEQRAILRSA